jgi:stage V sporulation protein G
MANPFVPGRRRGGASGRLDVGQEAGTGREVREVDITQIRVFPVDEDKLKAFVSVIFDGCFVVSDIKVIQGTEGLFVSMPSKRRKNGTFRDIAHPLNNETRRRFEDQIIARYQEVVAEDRREPGGVDLPAEVAPGDAVSPLESRDPGPG